ncbi:flagellar basal body rod protein FlgB [Methylomonas methanica]|uniref:Flagellar basal body rod protein FlgB n=1 Tax=Methylomonas methanica (strain DSM 25384 / MC09) TaxID=857087 RepID=F9ZV29_METMM|nr:flagellar basal body rod protein FlgB [Methylomonas methanica]AEF99462.1 flagellar basal-body rod protein FlgB [Methylomonas methanica MC09]
MAINFDNALGIHPQALALREKRSEILAANLANVDTPDYKAKDLDFKSVLSQTMDKAGRMERTQAGHLSGPQTLLGADLLYRNPQQPSLDGNTVEAHIEQSKYAENAVQYQASLRFINGRFSGLMSAIRGE